ncbi:MAG: Phenylalanyl-tRNA synthetase subunit beta [Promethearchaeota archaeon CR_4]|nr:MAG: Phenylalanyl-tRNA synthetase subunit beta [Candidatus Lokiarchaeota archaeon CR_4]
MPTIDLKITRLEKLLGKKLNLKQLEYDLQWIGLAIDRTDEDAGTIKIEYEPNRPDFSSPEGVARSLRGYYDIETGLKKYDIIPGSVEFLVESKVKDIRPYCLGAVIRNIDLDEEEVATLMNIQEQLHWMLGRDRRKVAIGVHDFDKVVPPFRYTAVAPEEIKFRPLQMEKYEMTPKEILEEHPKGVAYKWILEGMSQYPMIFDKNNDIISFPPIINGILTAVTDKTKNLFLDMTGTDMRTVSKAMNILVSCLADMGATVESVQMHYEDTGETIVSPNLDSSPWTARVDFINDMLGLKLSRSDIIKYLQKTRFGATVGKKKNEVDVLVPAYRTDILHEVDFTEEVAMGFGYQNLPLTLREGGVGKYHPLLVLGTRLRHIMIGVGYQEMVNFTLTNSQREFECMRTPAKKEKLLQLRNPVSLEYDTTRIALLPSLLYNVQFNLHEEKPINIFEVGDVIILDPSAETGAQRVGKMAAVTCSQEAEFTHIRSAFDFLCTGLGVLDKIEVKPAEHPSYTPGRAGDIYARGQKVGTIGEVHPEVLHNFQIGYPIAAFEISTEWLLEK